MLLYHADKKYYLTKDDVDTLKQTNPQQVVNILPQDDDWHVKTSNGNASGSWKFFLLLPICKFKLVSTSMKNKTISCQKSRKNLNHHFIFFCLLYRLNYFICYISGLFLPSRERKFVDNVANTVEQNKHCIYIFVIYSKHKARAYHATVEKNHVSQKPLAGAI